VAISDDDIERIRSSVSIVDVISQHVQLRRTGRNWVGLCPFHGEKTPSFNVREETGRYKCFGCDAAGDIFTFVQQMQHTDFVGAVEALASRAGIELTYTSGGQQRDRARRGRLVAAMDAAVEWYHQRLLTGDDAGPARSYLRARGLTGDDVRTFRIGWAPDGWDALATAGIASADDLTAAGLVFTNRRGRLQDAFRARVLFPIFTADGEPVALGGRILPGSDDPAKYKNSTETPIYTKSRTLYGLNWAKADIVRRGVAVVCEGYTDVIGFHRSGVPLAVATCGTAFTEDHVKLLKRYTSKVVLAFDADAAGQGAAERFYEWERAYDIEVAVARLPDGRDPGDLAQSDPEALSTAVDTAEPFLGFRLRRLMAGVPAGTPEARARLGERAIAMIAEHPNANVRRLYAGEVAAQLGLPAAEIVAAADRRDRSARVRVPSRAVRHDRESAEFVALCLLVTDWDAIAPWLIAEVFSDAIIREVFDLLVNAQGDVSAAITAAPDHLRELLDRVAVTDVEADPEAEARNLIAAAVRRELRAVPSAADADRIGRDAEARRRLEGIADPAAAAETAEWLLGWLADRAEERVGGG
jgi:DNA primase